MIQNILRVNCVVATCDYARIVPTQTYVLLPLHATNDERQAASLLCSALAARQLLATLHRHNPRCQPRAGGRSEYFGGRKTEDR